MLKNLLTKLQEKYTIAKHTLFSKYLISLICIFLIPFLIFTASIYYLLSNNYKEQLVNNENTVLQNMKYTTIHKYDQYLSLANKIINNYYVFKIPQTTIDSVSYDIYNQYVNAQTNLIYIYPEIQSFYIYNSDTGNFMANNGYASLSNFQDLSWFDYTKDTSRRFQWVYNRTPEFDTLIYSDQNNTHLVLNISIQKMYKSSFESITDPAFVIKDDTILYNNHLINFKSQDIEKSTFKVNNEKYHVFTSEIADNDNRILVVLKNHDEFTAPFKSIAETMMIFVIILLVIILFACNRLANKFSLPITSLVSNIGIDIDSSTKNELDILSEYVTKINQHNIPKHSLDINDAVYSLETSVLKLLRNIPLAAKDREVIDRVFTNNICNYTIATFKFDNTSIYEQYLKEIDNVATIICCDVNRLIFCIDDKTIAILFYSSIEKNVHDDTISLFLGRLSALNIVSPIIAIAKTISDVNNIHEQFLHTFEILKYRIYQNTYILHDTVTEFSYSLDVEKSETQFINAISEINFAKADQSLSAIISNMRDHMIHPDIVISYFSMLDIKIQNLPASCMFDSNELFFRTQPKFMYTPSMTLDDFFDYFLSVANNLIAGLNVKMSSKNVELINNIKEYIKENIESDISLTVISDYYGITPQYISVLFKRETGQNFIKYLVEEKLEHAKELLKTTNLPVKNIAEKIGYTDRSFFAIFKKNTGVTPKQFRNSISNNNI